jgi:hypothetical protein
MSHGLSLWPLATRVGSPVYLKVDADGPRCAFAYGELLPRRSRQPIVTFIIQSIR